MNTPQQEAPKKVHRGLKRLAIAIIIAVAALYIISIVSTYAFEKSVKETLISTNKEITGQEVTIDDVKVDL